VSLWRRFFEERELEEEEQLEIIADSFLNLHFESDNGNEQLRPIDAELAREARRSFVQDYYRGLRAAGNRDPVDRMEMVSRVAREAQREQRQLNQPQLDIPVGQEYVYRAQ
jgi:hypothetical protein